MKHVCDLCDNEPITKVCRIYMRNYKCGAEPLNRYGMHPFTIRIGSNCSKKIRKNTKCSRGRG